MRNLWEVMTDIVPSKRVLANACAPVSRVAGWARVERVGALEKQRRQQKTSMQMRKCNACG